MCGCIRHPQAPWLFLAGTHAVGLGQSSQPKVCSLVMECMETESEKVLSFYLWCRTPL